MNIISKFNLKIVKYLYFSVTKDVFAMTELNFSISFAMVTNSHMGSSSRKTYSKKSMSQFLRHKIGKTLSEMAYKSSLNCG